MRGLINFRTVRSTNPSLSLQVYIAGSNPTGSTILGSVYVCVCVCVCVCVHNMCACMEERERESSSRGEIERDDDMFGKSG